MRAESQVASQASTGGTLLHLLTPLLSTVYR